VPEGLCPVTVLRSYKKTNELGLVILAMGKAYWTFEVDGRYLICVQRSDALAVLKELQAYGALSNRARRRRHVAVRPLYAVGPTSFVLYGLLLIVVFALQQRWPLALHGRVDSIAMVEGGEWWRAFTALTLHGDVVHMVSNLVGGIGFMLLVCRIFGVRLAWFLVLCGAVLGNVLNAWVQFPQAHYSIGASTGVFAALGLLTGSGAMQAFQGSRQGSMALPVWFLPLFAGLTLLGMLGIGDANTDVAAHISGFLVGGILGLLAELVLWRQYRQQVAT